MAPVTLSPLPGGMTVPPLFGWGDILTVLALLVVLAVAFVVITAAGTDASGRAEWQASLDARSGRRRYPTADPDDPSPTGGDPASCTRPGRW
jgi:hypothetical protein